MPDLLHEISDESISETLTGMLHTQHNLIIVISSKFVFLQYY